MKNSLIHIKHLIVIPAVLSMLFTQLPAQFAPAAGLPGTTAVYKDSSVITGWAKGCEVNRGPIEIDDPELTYDGSSLPTIGSASDAMGKADNKVVSLGDGGTAILTFDQPITNGEGPDFAVFENGFFLAGSDTLAFLELAFVEVSTDGKRFVRFPAISNISTDEQYGNFSYIDARLIYNFAGKYTAGYGTPFDLADVNDSSGIDVNDINYVKIVDVIGDLSDTYASLDSKGNKINDPWPTPYNTCGFDLDAVGIIKEGTATGIGYEKETGVMVYPNPVSRNLYIGFPDRNTLNTNAEISIFDIYGKKVFEGIPDADGKIGMGKFPSGIYMVKITADKISTVQRILKQ